MSIFLSRSGRIEGPFEASIVDAWRSSGDLERYAWIFRPEAQSWEPIHSKPSTFPQIVQVEVKKAAPPIFPEKPRAVLDNLPSIEPETMRALESTPETTSMISLENKDRVLCHDYRHFIAGDILATAQGKLEIFVGSSQGKAFPFRKDQRLLTQIMNSDTRELENASAIVTRITHVASGFQVELAIHRAAAA